MCYKFAESVSNLGASRICHFHREIGHDSFYCTIEIVSRFRFSLSQTSCFNHWQDHLTRTSVRSSRLTSYFCIQAADTGTCFSNPDNWGLDRCSFVSIIHSTGVDITIDLFAHFTNRKMESFYSFGNCPLSLAVDAFTAGWTEERAWICPPVSLVIPALLKLCSTKMTGIFILPCWRTAGFWNFLFSNRTHALPQCWKIESIFPHIVRGKYCYNPLMKGSTAFPFLVIHLVSAGPGYTVNSGLIPCPRQLIR